MQLREKPGINVGATKDIHPGDYPYFTEPDRKRMEEKRLQEQSKRQAMQNIFLQQMEEEGEMLQAHEDRGAAMGERELAEIRDLRMTLAKEAQQLSETLIQELMETQTPYSQVSERIRILFTSEGRRL